MRRSRIRSGPGIGHALSIPRRDGHDACSCGGGGGLLGGTDIGGEGLEDRALSQALDFFGGGLVPEDAVSPLKV